MKTKVTKEAVKDLINSTGRNSEWTLKYLKALKFVLPMLEDGREETAIGLIVKALADEYPYLSEDGAVEAEIEAVYNYVRELDYYIDKEKVLDATIAELTEVNQKIQRLKLLLPIVMKTFKNFDERTKALFAVCDELMRADGVTSLNYSEKLDIFRSESVDVLRDDPALAPSLEAYELACDVNELLQ